MSEIGNRKEDHLELCATGQVKYRITTTLLEEVNFVHLSLPELALDQVDTRCQILGKDLSAPFLISAMTGGTDRTGRINRDLAEVAEELGIGFALGSQRPMLQDGGKTWTFAVRDQAPTTLVIGNLGLWQAIKLDPLAIDELGQRVGADAMALHLNPAQELVQPGGDRDFRGGLETLETLAKRLSLPLLVKETGCGIGSGTAKMLRGVGIEHLDVAGAGGTSWVGVEAHRVQDESGHKLGELLREWGVPTAAALVQSAPLGFETLIASGGIEHGLDAARAIALGAAAVGIARPVLEAYWKDGASGARDYLVGVIAGLRAVMLLTGSANLEDLRKAPHLIGSGLDKWIDESNRHP